MTETRADVAAELARLSELEAKVLPFVHSDDRAYAQRSVDKVIRIIERREQLAAAELRLAQN